MLTILLAPWAAGQSTVSSKLEAVGTGTKAARIDAKVLHGRTGDAWTPIEVAGGKALTLSRRGFNYALLSELLFGLIMTLTFTLGAGMLVQEGPDAVRELLIATIGCNIAWGIIDGVFYINGQIFERARLARLGTMIRAGVDDRAMLAAAGVNVMTNGIPLEHPPTALPSAAIPAAPFASSCPRRPGRSGFSRLSAGRLKPPSPNFFHAS